MSSKASRSPSWLRKPVKDHYNSFLKSSYNLNHQDDLQQNECGRWSTLSLKASSPLTGDSVLTEG